MVAVAIIVKVVACRAVAIVANVVVRPVIIVEIQQRYYLSRQLRKNLHTSTFVWVNFIT